MMRKSLFLSILGRRLFPHIESHVAITLHSPWDFKTGLLMLFILSFISLPVESRDFTINPANVDTTGRTLVTKALNDAISQCHEKGGGRVVVPRGHYLCGTIFLQSGVELHLQQGAVIMASSHKEDFIIQPRDRCRSQKDKNGWSAFIFASNCHDIAITGKGTIDGRGRGKRNIAEGGNGRPNNIVFISCRRVKIEDVTIMNSPGWNQHYFNCEDMTIRRIHSWNHCNGNNDGLDLDNCRRVKVSHCIIDSDDDGIVLKSTGLGRCEDVTIEHCTISSYANAIKCGTESVGGFRHIKVKNCVVRPSSNKGPKILKTTPTGITALSLEMVDGGELSDVLVDHLDIVGTECPIYIRLANRGRNQIDGVNTPPAHVGTLRNVVLSNIKARETGNFGSSITGIPGYYVENITLRHIDIQSKGGLTKGNYRTKGDNKGMRHDIAGNNHPDAYWATAEEVEEGEKSYPQPTLWGNLPCYGLFARHVKNLRLRDVSFTTRLPDPRPKTLMVDTDYSCR